MNILESLFKYGSRPVRDLVELGNITKTGLGVKRVKAPEYTLDQLKQFADNGGSKTFLGSSQQQQYKRDLGKSQEAFGKVQNYKPVTLYDDEMEGLLDYDRAFKDAAIAGSFMMPGIGSGLGGALATGAIGGAMGGYGGSKKGEELTSTLTGAGMGALFGGAGYGLGKLAQSMKGVKVNPKMVKGQASKLGMSPEEFGKETTKVLEDMSKRGFDVSSPKTIANNYKPYLDMIQKEAQSAGKLAQQAADISDIKAIYQGKEAFLKGSSGAVGEFKKLSMDLFTNPNPTIDDVLGYKMAIDKLGGGVQKLQGSGKYLSNIMNEIRNESRSLVAGNELVDSVLSSFSSALKLKDTILKNPEIAGKIGIGGIFPIKMSANLRPLQDSLRQGGSVQKSVGGVVGSGLGQLSKGLTGQGKVSLTGPMVGIGAMGQQQGQPQEPRVQEQGMLGDDDPGMIAIRQAFSGGAQGQPTSQEYTLQDGIKEAVQMLPNASESTILSYAQALVKQNSQTGGAGKDLNTTQSKYYGVSESAKSASTLLDQMASVQGQELPGFGKTVTSAIADLFNISDPRMLEYRNKIASIDLAVSNLIAGTNISASEAKRLHKLVPTMGDSVEEAKSKLAELDSLGITGAGLSGMQDNSEDSMVNDYDSWSQ